MPHRAARLPLINAVPAQRLSRIGHPPPVPPGQPGPRGRALAARASRLWRRSGRRGWRRAGWHEGAAG